MTKKTLLALAVILTLWSFSGSLHAQIITTVVGSTGIGDGGAATQATVNPTGVAVDANGNVYIAEQENNRIRKVSPGGIITTVAGTGIAGLSGDGGPATSARLNFPRSVAVDAAGNLYFSDVNNHRIRRVSTAGIITTVAGSDFGGGFAGDGGPATAAKLFYPNGITLDAAGNLYIVDTNNHRVRKVNTSGIISTIAGTGVQGFSGDGGPATSAQFNLPAAVAVGSDGSLFVTIPENNNCRVRKIAPNGIITTFAGTATCNYADDGGAATSASLNSPLGVAVDGAGNVFIAERDNHRIRRVATNGIISTVAGSTNGYGYSGDGGAATAASLASPRAVAVDGSGKIYIADRDNGRIRMISSAGIISTLAGPNNGGFGGDGGLATSAIINYPTDVKTDKNGNYFIADHRNNRVRKVDADRLISTVAGMGSAGFAGDGGLATEAHLNGVHSILPDGNGNLLIADAFNNRIRKVNAAGIITTIVGSSNYGFSGDGGPATSAHLRTPYALALDNSGILYITDSNNNRIRRIGSNGVITTVVGTGTPGFGGDGGPATSAQIDFPTGIGFDAANNLYFADNRSHRIRRVSPAGIISTVAGDGSRGFSGDNGLATAAQLLFPWKVTASANGVVFFSDNGNTRVRRIGTDGVISTVVGTYGRGFSGDGSDANRAQLNGPFGLGLDGAGNMLIADANNARIRKVSCIDPPIINIVASSNNVCVGDEVTLTASATGNTENLSFTWSSNTIPKSINTVSLTAVSSSNSFSVIATTPTGCTTTASGSFNAGKLTSLKSGDWHDPATWSCGRVPSGKDTVTINNGHSEMVRFIGTVNLLNLT